MPKTLLWAWAALVAALYAVLAYGSYVTLPSLTDGLLGFDMQIFGMNKDEAVAYERALTEAGRAYYLDWLRPLDSVFIVVLTGFLLALSWTFKGVLGGLGAVAALAYAGFDWLENSLVADVMTYGSKETLSDIGFIAKTTTAKFVSLGLAIIALSLAFNRRRSHAQR